MQIEDILDVTNLRRMVEGGYISAREHPEFPLTIYNYTDKATYANEWNQETLNCRGLIVNHATGEVIARGLPKMFGYGQLQPQDKPPLDTVVDAHNKWDGSLGIEYRWEGVNYIAIRGSFTSEQALWATKYNHENFINFEGDSTFTSLFEIIYPENRIIVDYGDWSNLVYLGGVYNESGKFVPANRNHDVVLGVTLGDLIENHMTRENAEGWIVHPRGYHPFKLKQEDYLALARAASRLSKKEVWRWVCDDVVDERIAALPDEFHEWAIETAAEITTARDATIERVYEVSRRLLMENAQAHDRGRQARLFQTHLSGLDLQLAFAMLDNDRPKAERIALKGLEPKGSGM